MIHDDPVGVKWIVSRGCLASQSAIAGVLWVARLSYTRCTSSWSGTALSMAVRNFLNSTAPVLAVQCGDDRAVGDVERGEQAGDPAAGIVVATRSGIPGIIGSTGWERSRACMPLFSSTHSTTAFSGGLWYRPTTSTTLCTNNGSLESLKPSTRCGLSSNRRQIRPIVDLDSPERSAID